MFWYLQLKTIENSKKNLCVFWYFQWKTIQKSKKTYVFFGIYNWKPLKITENPLVFGVYSRKPFKIAKPLCVFWYLQLKTIESRKKPMCFLVFSMETIENSKKTHRVFAIFNGKPLKIAKNLCVFWYLQSKTRGSMARCILAVSIHAFGCAGTPNSLFFCFDAAPDLL